MNTLDAFSKLDNILEEGLDDLYRTPAFKDIPKETLTKIVAADPTANVAMDRKGKYSSWLLNLYVKKNLKLEDLYKATQYLIDFDRYKQKLERKDINQYKSLPDLYDALEEVKNRAPTEHELAKQRKKDAHKAGKEIENHATKLFENDKWVIWIPKDHAGACSLGRFGGQQAQWCTATVDNDYYYNMYANQGPLYVIINKANPAEKYQYHFESGQFMDSSDRPLHGAVKFMKSNNLFNPVLQNIANENFKGETADKTCKVGFDKAAEILGGENRGDITSDFIEKLFASELDWWDYFDYNLLEYSLPDLDDRNIKELQKLNNKLPDDINKQYFSSCEEFLDTYFPEAEDIVIGDEDLSSVLSRALREGHITGSQDECYDDFYKALENCFTKGYKINYDDSQLEFIASIAELVESSMCGEINEFDAYRSNFDEDLFISTIIRNGFSFYEPPYGWDGFSEETFNEYLYEMLHY